MGGEFWNAATNPSPSIQRTEAWSITPVEMPWVGYKWRYSDQQQPRFTANGYARTLRRAKREIRRARRMARREQRRG